MAILKLFLSGDVMTGRGIDQILGHPGDPTLYEGWARSALAYVELAERRNGSILRGVDPSYVWGDALALLDEAGTDVRIINLETAVTDRGEPWPRKGIHYRMHPDNVGVVSAAKIDCCVLANNHVLDWSYPGLEQTLSSVRSAGSLTVGAGLDERQATAPVVVETDQGGRVVVVAVGAESSGVEASWEAGDDRPGVAMTTLSTADIEALAERIASVARPGDIVVVSIHWGPNWGYHIPSVHRRFAHSLIDEAGAHVVHGHSSHHPMAIEVYQGRPIFYGCGDLINDYEGIGGHEVYRPDLGLVYLVGIDTMTGSLTELELVPMRMFRFQLTMAEVDDRLWLAHQLSQEGEALGTAVEPADETLMVRW